MNRKINAFTKNLAIVMSGTIVAQVINILIAPLLSRIYAPSAFGVFAVYTSILSILGVVAALRFELAILIPKSKRAATQIFYLATLLVVIMTIFTLIVVALFHYEIAELLGGKEYIFMIWCLPISVFVLGLFKTLNQLITRFKEFKSLSYSQMNRSGASASVQISSGFYLSNPSGLIAGQIIGQTVAVLYMIRKLNHKKYLSLNINLKRMQVLFKKYKQFAMFSAPQALLNSMSQNILVLLLALFFSSTIVGYYALCERILKIPLRMIGQSLRQVFYQKASETHNRNINTQIITKRLTIYLFLGGIIPVLVIMLYGPSLFSLTLGGEWNQAGTYAQILIPAFFLNLINIPSLVIIPIINLQKFHMNYEIILTVLRIGAVLLGGWVDSIILSLSFYSIVSVVMNLILIIVVIRSAGNPSR